MEAQLLLRTRWRRGRPCMRDARTLRYLECTFSVTRRKRFFFTGPCVRKWLANFLFLDLSLHAQHAHTHTRTHTHTHTHTRTHAHTHNTASAAHDSSKLQGRLISESVCHCVFSDDLQPFTGVMTTRWW